MIDTPNIPVPTTHIPMTAPLEKPVLKASLKLLSARLAHLALARVDTDMPAQAAINEVMLPTM